MLLIKHAKICAPTDLGICDVLIGGGVILAIEKEIQTQSIIQQVWDAEGKYMTPGLIDQHVHIAGAGGTKGFASRTPNIEISEFIACGTTTAVGLLGTDGTTRSLKDLYAKAKGLEQDGMSAFMFTSFFGLPPITLTGSIQDDMILIDNVLGCKVAISDVRSSYPSEKELLNLLQQVRVGGLLSGKKGILHLHLGNLESKIDILLRLVRDYDFPIENISPTHVGRTKPLFEQSLEFARLGGMIDITTGASQYTAPWKSVLYALEEGIPLEKMTFSSDGNTALSKLDKEGKLIGLRRAPIHKNLENVIALIKEGELSASDAFSLVTTNPARNLGLKHKGDIKIGYDADLCFFDEQYQLMDVFAKGKQLMHDKAVIVKGKFE